MNLIKTLHNLILKIGGKTQTLRRDDPIALEVEELVKNGADEELIKEKVENAYKINKVFDGISVEFDNNGYVYINNEQLPRSISGKITEYSNLDRHERIKALINFWNNCKLNPDRVAQTDLFQFLEHNNIPITTDGYFIAYKTVCRNENNDLVDSYTRKVLNNVGTVVTMDRKYCNANRDQTCSYGLHAAAYDYAVHVYGSPVLISVKINPKDVVAIPTDYNQQKLRCCEYTVLEILEDKQKYVGNIIDDFANDVIYVGAMND